MKITDDCRDCLLFRVRFEAALCTEDEGAISEAVDAARRLLDTIWNDDVPAPVIAGAVHRCCYRKIGSSDPYRTLKYNDTMAAQMADLRSVIRGLIFATASRAAVMGNSMDYAVLGHSIEDDFTGFFRREFSKGLYHDDSQEVEELSRRVVYFTDNTGEILFDKILIEELKKLGAHVTVAVKDAPMLNDATLDEARDAGIEEVADHLTTTGGGAELGINLDLIPPDLSSAIEKATLIIAKGLANYESLSDQPGLPPVAYLMVVKCDVVARDLGVPKGMKIARIIR